VASNKATAVDDRRHLSEKKSNNGDENKLRAVGFNLSVGGKTMNTPMSTGFAMASRVEKFPAAELVSLRSNLLSSGLDKWQAAELVSMFLMGRGYGVSRQEAVDAVIRMEGMHCSIESMQQELERVAQVM
jgi:hypothetical protein